MSDNSNAASKMKNLQDDEDCDTSIEPPSWWEPCSERAVSFSSLNFLDSYSTVFESVQKSLKNSTISGEISDDEGSISINDMDNSELRTDFSETDEENGEAAHGQSGYPSSYEGSESGENEEESDDEEELSTASSFSTTSTSSSDSSGFSSSSSDDTSSFSFDDSFHSSDETTSSFDTSSSLDTESIIEH